MQNSNTIMEDTTMRKILSVFIIAIIATAAFAQSPTPEQTYKMNADALKMVKKYKMQSDMTRPQGFVALFASLDTQIYNDLMGLSSEKTLSVSEYSDLLFSEVVQNRPKELRSGMVRVDIQNLKKNRVFLNDGKWCMEVSFEKALTYPNYCGVRFSSNEYYDSYYLMTMVLSWNDSLQNCSIESLDGRLLNNKNRLGEYFVIVPSVKKKDAKRDQLIRVDGHSLKFSNYNGGQCILPDGVAITYPRDPEMVFDTIRMKQGCEIYSFTYNPLNMRLKPHYNIGVVPFGKAANGLSLSKSIHHEFGLDLGYMIPTKGLFQMGFYAGVGFASSSAVLGMDTVHYHYQTGPEADIDGDSYIRHYTIERASQKLSMKDLTIPIYLDFNFHLHKIVSLYLDLGIKNYINLSANLSDLTGTYASWGVYPQYSDLVLDHTTGLTQFAASGTTLPAQTTSSTIDINGYSMDLLSALGVRIKLKDKQFFPLYFDFSIGYQHSLLAPYKNANALKVSDIQGNVSAQEAFSTYTVESGESTMPLSAFVSELKRKMVTLNFGITYKF